MKKQYMQDMSWDEFEERLKQCDYTVIIPLGSTEQHGPYPLGVDCYNAMGPAKRLTELTDDVIIAPLIPVSYSAYHARFPGTITLRFETVIALYEDICESLIRAGTQKIIWLEGHEGCSDAAAIVSKRLRDKYGVLFVSVAYWHFLAEIRPDYSKIRQISEGHAGINEGSITLACVSEELREDIRRRAVNYVSKDAKIPWGTENLITPRWNGQLRCLSAKLKTSTVGEQMLWVNFPGGNFQDFTPYGHITEDMLAHSVEYGKELIEITAQHLLKILKEIRKIKVPIESKPHRIRRDL